MRLVFLQRISVLASNDCCPFLFTFMKGFTTDPTGDKMISLMISLSVPFRVNQYRFQTKPKQG